jgi:hypothetical protein
MPSTPCRVRTPANTGDRFGYFERRDGDQYRTGDGKKYAKRTSAPLSSRRVSRRAFTGV